ncbi:MAG: helix-turn-helix domain containing protein [Rhizobiaceae bacterium]|nr:helix-turn-helix domain containing protein [Rhizobiaceae bacterium]
MAKPGTRDRLIKSAERLMARNGISEVSVRRITDDAGANIASVNYHFGGKDELVQEVLTTRFNILDAEMIAGLEELVARAEREKRDYALDEVVGVYLSVLVKLGIDHKRNSLDPFILLIQRASFERDAALRTAQNPQGQGLSLLVTMVAKSSGRPVTMNGDFNLMLSLMFSGAVAMMRAIVSDENTENAARSCRAIEVYVVNGVTAFIENVFPPA